MEKKAAENMEWVSAPPEHFTGRVWFGAMAEPETEQDLNVLGVQFEPGARTDWHSHPSGQALYVVSGSGVVANDSGERIEMSAGDTVNTPPNELHWHGAREDSPMLHLSITYGGATIWSEDKVSDEDYRG